MWIQAMVIINGYTRKKFQDHSQMDDVVNYWMRDRQQDSAIWLNEFCKPSSEFTYLGFLKMLNDCKSGNEIDSGQILASQ
jgi:hypothetical protein